MDRFYITTAIDYVNSRPHLGTAYEKITADVIARYKRLAGVPTHFLMGNDEFSQNVYRRARERGLDPLAYCDEMEAIFRGVWARLDISYDDFIRTTQPRHRTAVIELVNRVHANGDIYEGFYEGWYCESCEAFKQEKDLIDGQCPAHGRPPEWIKEKNYFFALSKYQQRLLDHYEAHADFLRPESRRNEIRRLVEGGLEDISISRAGQLWGIPVPFDPESVIYVWFDALTNYLSAIGFASDPDMFARWWPASVHVVGKDITRFHCVFWPAMLMSAGLPLPTQVFGHGWVHLKGQKMSKSLGTTVDPLEAVDRFGPDPLRLYLVKEIAYGQDGDFSWERFEERYNVDLANNLGNLVSRVTAMADRYRSGGLDPVRDGTDAGGGTGGRGSLAALAGKVLSAYREAMDDFALQNGAAEAFRLVDATNEFIASTEPWALARDPQQRERLNQVLHEAAEAVRIAAVLLLPIMPRSARAIASRMGETRDLDRLTLDEAARWSTGEARQLHLGDPMWPRLEPRVEPTDVPETKDAPDARAAAPSPKPKRRPSTMSEDKSQTEGPPQAQAPSAPSTSPAAAAAAAAPSTTLAPAVPRRSIDEFLQIELRTAKILAAEPVPKSRKLLKVEVDVGTERRTLVAGIAEAYAPDALVGRTIIIVANLQPAKLMGVESNGMLLAASPEGGRPMLLQVDGDVPPGTRIR